jgi:tryptophan synthase alpha chain
MPIENLLAALKDNNAPPTLLGFGISNPNQVKEAIEFGAAGAISGSAVVKIIQDNLTNEIQMLNDLKSFKQAMKLATTI